MSDMRQPTSMATVAAAQIELLRRQMFPLGILGVALLFLFAIHSAIGPDYREGHGWLAMPLLSMVLPFLSVIGGLAAGLCWVNESPTRRRYHRSLPVSHVRHDLTRVLIALTWLLIVLTVFFFIAAAFEHPFAREQWLMRAPTTMFAFVAVPVLVFLLCSAIAIAFDWMAVWLGVIMVVAMVMDMPFVERSFPEIADISDSVIWNRNGPYSLARALTGHEEAAPWRNYEEISRVHQVAVRSGIAQPDVMMRALDHARPFNTPTRNWLNALLVWYVIAILGVALALRRRPVG